MQIAQKVWTWTAAFRCRHGWRCGVGIDRERDGVGMGGGMGGVRVWVWAAAWRVFSSSPV
jgi:hypothetical protein